MWTSLRLTMCVWSWICEAQHVKSMKLFDQSYTLQPISASELFPSDFQVISKWYPSGARVPTKSLPNVSQVAPECQPSAPLTSSPRCCVPVWWAPAATRRASDRASGWSPSTSDRRSWTVTLASFVPAPDTCFVFSMKEVYFLIKSFNFLIVFNFFGPKDFRLSSDGLCHSDSLIQWHT